MTEADRIIFEIEISRMRKAAKDFAFLGENVKCIEKLLWVEYFKDALEEENG